MAQSSTSQLAGPESHAFWASLPSNVKGEVLKNVPEDQLGPIIRNHNLISKEAKLQAIADTLQHMVDSHETTHDLTAKDMCAALHTLAMVQFERGDLAASIATYRRLIATSEERDGPDTALAARHNLALALMKYGQYVEAEGILRKLLPFEKEKIGESSPQALGCLRILIEVLTKQGKVQEARGLLGEGWDLVRGMKGGDPAREDESRAMSEVETNLAEGGTRP